MLPTRGDTGHHFEAGLAYTLPVEKFPLSIAWYTMFAGADRKMIDKGEEKQAYSSYVELNYPFSVKGVDLNATCGVVPYETPQYNVNGFAVTNLALKATKAIRHPSIRDIFFPAFCRYHSACL